MPDFQIVGSKVPDIYASSKALGDLRYLDDLNIGSLLYGKALRSPFPHARILHIDTARAKTLPGVKAVITGEDIPKLKFSTHPGIWDRYPLAVGKVRYAGEAMAAVAAIDEEVAEEALSLIKVDYEPLPHIFDPRVALQPGAILIHDEKERNISFKLTKSYGEIEKGFKEADHIREDTFCTVPNNHAAIEPHGIISRWHSNGSLTMWSNTQGPFRLRGMIYDALGLTEDKIRIIKPAVGGGFGGKTRPLDIDLISARLSQITGKPVKIVLTREEVFICTHQRHPMYITLRTGIKKSGLLKSMELKAVVDGGAYTGSATIPLNLGAHQLMITYILPHVRYEAVRVFTNKPMGGPMRGHGAPQVRFAVESQLDMIAQDLNLDPLQLRLMNITYAGYDHPAKKRISSCGLREAIEAVAAALDWREKKGKLPDGHGLGLACSNFACGPKPYPHAGGGVVIEINREGGVNILSGAADIGQGTDTVLCQIVAEELGVKMEDVRITAADTAVTPFDLGTFGSGVTFRVGNAAIMASKDVKRQLLEIISLQLEAPPDKITLSGGKVIVQGYPDRRMTFREAVKAYYNAGKSVPLVGKGFYEPECVSGDIAEGPETPAYAFYCQGAEVKVNKDTGEIKVLKLVTAVDCGKAINLLNVEGQADGSMAGGLGMALYEELIDNEGTYSNSSLLNYLVPTSTDVPSEMPSRVIETNDPFGPFGAKEAGEGMLVSVPPAISNAICDAVGARITDLPITPDKILKDIKAGLAGPLQTS